MIRKVVEISQRSADLSAHNGQLELRFHDAGLEKVSVPCEDMGVLVVDNAQVRYAHNALCELAEAGAVVAICGRNHLPAALLMPVSTHTEVSARLHDQIHVKKPVMKRLWRQLVVAKIRAQADNLGQSPAALHLRALARRVGSGDPSNVEAQAAKAYWRAWCPSSAPSFRREADGTDTLNGMLNYGYAIVRASVARSLVGAGLHPALGVHHANRANPFCLADDLMEPLRPLVDARVRFLFERGEREVCPVVKRELLGVLTQTVETGETTGPLMTSLERMAASLARCYAGEELCVVIPKAAPHGA